MGDPRMKHMSDMDVIVALWRKRVEWLWRMSEVTAYRGDLYIEWLDEQIMGDEANASKTPKG